MGLTCKTMPTLRIRLIFLDNFFGNKKAPVTKLEVHKWAVDQSGGVMLTADDIARTLVMLGSDASAALNGHNLIADKGLSASVATGQVDYSALG